jgi:hypothetical protein
MADPASSANPAPIIPTPMPPTPVPTAPDMPTMNEAPGDAGLGGAAAGPLKPQQAPLHSRIAEGIIHAFAGTDGTAGSALKSALAGGLAGLAAAAKTPMKPGAPILGGLGIGAEAGMAQTQKNTAQKNEFAQQQLENAQKKQTIDLAQQREQREGSQFDQEQKIRVMENARQQAESLQRGKEMEQRAVLVDQQIAAGKYDAVKKTADDLRFYSDRVDALKRSGGQILKVNGSEAPSFDHLGDAQTYAAKNFDAVAHPEYATELVQDPGSLKWQIYEKKYEPLKDWTIKDSTGKPMSIYTDSTGKIAAEKQIAETRHYNNIANKSSLDLKRDLESFKEEGTVKGARKELNKVGGDYTKLSPGSKSALLGDAQNQFTKVNTLLERIESKQVDIRTPEEEDMLNQYKPVRDAYAHTIADITRPSWVPKPGEEPAKPAAQAPTAPAPTRPPGVPPSYTYQTGAKGPGWYKPAEAPAAATE